MTAVAIPAKAKPKGHTARLGAMNIPVTDTPSSAALGQPINAAPTFRIFTRVS
jgi:hypothetical protein